MPPEELWTPEDVADYLGVTVRTVTKWLREGKLKGMKAGKLWRVPLSAVLEFTEQQPTDWVLALHIDAESGTLWLEPERVPDVDPDETLDMPDEWWERLAETLPDEGGWEDVRTHIYAALRHKGWERADEKNGAS